MRAGWRIGGKVHDVAQTPAKGRKARTTRDKPTVEPVTGQVEDAVVVESEGAAAPAADAAPVETPPVTSEPDTAPFETPPAPSEPDTPPDDEPASRPKVADPPEPQRRGGFVPLVLGGAIAAALGYGAAYLQTAQDRIDRANTAAAQADAIARLQTDLAATSDLSARVDGLATAQADMATNFAAIPDTIAPQIADLTARIDAVERAPLADGSLTETALAAYESDIAALRDELATQRQSMSDLAADAQAQLAAARDQAAQITEDNAATADRAAARAALAQVVAALESGAPYDAALPELGIVATDPLPEALTAPAPEGIPTLAALQAAYPEAARAALASARRSGEAGESNTGLTAFLRTQFDVRSVTPQDGDTVDAILSRIEGALGRAQLTEAIALVGTLPDSARTDMADWAALAATRVNALAAIDALSSTLNVN